jgi:hypothetical protein
MDSPTTAEKILVLVDCFVMAHLLGRFTGNPRARKASATAIRNCPPAHEARRAPRTGSTSGEKHTRPPT